MEDETVTRIVRNAIQCNVCGDIIESEYTHDFKWCSCGNCAVDGGHSYLKRCGDNWTDLSVCEVVTNIEELDISNTNVTDLSPLKDMPNLKKLIAENCNIDDWSPVSDIDEVIK